KALHSRSLKFIAKSPHFVHLYLISDWSHTALIMPDVRSAPLNRAANKIFGNSTPHKRRNQATSGDHDNREKKISPNLTTREKNRPLNRSEGKGQHVADRHPANAGHDFKLQSSKPPNSVHLCVAVLRVC